MYVAELLRSWHHTRHASSANQSCDFLAMATFYEESATQQDPEETGQICIASHSPLLHTQRTTLSSTYTLTHDIGERDSAPTQVTDKTEEPYRPALQQKQQKLPPPSPLPPPSENTTLLGKQKKIYKRITKHCKRIAVILIPTVIIGLGLTGLFIGAIMDTHTTPSTSSHLTAYRGQSAPLVMLLATYDDSEYSSFMVSSDTHTDFSATLWIVQSIEPIRNTYNDDVILQDLRNLQLYTLTGSTFKLTVLSHGPAGANATFEFRNKSTNQVLANWTVSPSNTSQTFNYTTEAPGFIEILPINNGLNGSLIQNFTINELNDSSLEQSHYQCTLNSTSRSCNHTTIYSTNNLLASVTLDADSNIYPTFNTTLSGEAKRTLPILVAYSAGALIGIFLLITIVLIVLCFYYSSVKMVR